MDGRKYLPCPFSSKEETRKLFVATCDTRSGWKEFQAMKVWNVTGNSLRSKGIFMKNVCKGRNWGNHGFLTKPLLYVEFLKQLPAVSELGGLTHAILMDSDTFWSTNSIESIWNKYDCARGNKSIVMSTEMSCWVGRYCTTEDIHRWYNNTPMTPSFSPFANSGVVMGEIGKLQEMLEYIIRNNRSYYITYYKNKFDDQYAMADYAINVAPQVVALDYHQQLLASFSIHAPGIPHEDGWPFACKAKTGEVCKSCPIWTNLLSRQNHFTMDKETCILHRKYWPKMPLEEEMSSLAMDPIIWHGNGVGKRTYYDNGHKVFLCNLEKRNMTVDDHAQSFG